MFCLVICQGVNICLRHIAAEVLVCRLIVKLFKL